MRITVFGATGKVGRLVVDELLAHGHTVTAFTHSHPLQQSSSTIITVQGDIYNPGDVDRAIQTSDAVISALGSWGTVRKDVLTNATQNIIPSMEKHSVKRFISVTGSGAQTPNEKTNIIEKLSHRIFGLIAPKILRDGEQHIALLTNSDLDWTVIRSPVMTNRGNPKNYQLSLRNRLYKLTIHRHAVASSIVDQLEETRFTRQAPYITRS